MVSRKKRNTKKRKHSKILKQKFIKVNKSSKPLTLNQLRKKVIKRNNAQITELHEIDLIVAQEKDYGSKYKFIFDGSAMVNGKYISDFLLSGKTQNKGELVYLNGVSKEICKEKYCQYWTPLTLQVCDGNILAWNCIGGTFVYLK